MDAKIPNSLKEANRTRNVHVIAFHERAKIAVEELIDEGYVKQDVALFADLVMDLAKRLD
jgi:hypothetical protein